MKQVIRIVGSPLGDRDPHDGRFLSFYDPHVGSHGKMDSTDDIAKALVFEDVHAALECWRQINRNRPLRLDGKPNRPLTAFTIEVVNLP